MDSSNSQSAAAPNAATPKNAQRVTRRPTAGRAGPAASPTPATTHVAAGPSAPAATSSTAAPVAAPPATAGLSTAMQLRMAAAAAGGPAGRPVMVMGPNGVPIRVRPFPGGALAAAQAGGQPQGFAAQQAGGAGAGGLRGGTGGGLFAPKTMRMLVTIRNIALFVGAILILRLVASSHGPLPTIIVGALMHRAGMFTLVQSAYARLRKSFGGDEAAYEMMLRRADSMRAPVTKKEGSISQKGKSISYGFSCMQGWRRSMEDAHTMILDGTTHEPHLHTPPPQWRIPSHPSLGPVHNQGNPTGTGGFFAVFDGHCGPRVAHYCSEHLYHFVHKSPAFAAKNYKQALIDGFVGMDQHLHQHTPEERSGCTAVAVLISEDGKTLYCANAGDSRAIVGQQRPPAGSGSPSAFPAAFVPVVDGAMGVGHGFESISEDHKPYNKTEQQRIERAGSMVLNKRVNGVLALSRAMGDFSFKRNRAVPWTEQAVTCAPDVKVLSIDLERDQFIVIACDGIWDVKTNEDVAAFVRLRLRKRMALHTICEQLMHACLSNRPFGNGCDNMSVIIVTLDDSAFMKAVGGPSAGVATPAVRASTVSPAMSPEKKAATATAAVPSLAPATKINLDGDEKDEKKTDDEPAAAAASLLPASAATRKAKKPATLVTTSTTTATDAPTADASAAKTENDEEEEEVASPSLVRPETASFPAATADGEEEAPSPRREADDDGDDENGSSSDDAKEDEEEKGAAHAEGDHEDEEGDAASAEGNVSSVLSEGTDAATVGEREGEEQSEEEIAEALEAAKIFSPKTPHELRESQHWDNATPKATTTAAGAANEDEDDE